MEDLSSLDPHRFERLSTREREVLDSAVLGRTDEQIAQELSLSVSTVNSYWVRIRGKLGPRSRTELVADVLRHECGLRFADLIAENERLSAEGQRAHEALATSEKNRRNERGSGWHLNALDHVADAILVCRPPGEIVYANLQAEHLFAAEPGELAGLMMWELAIEEDQETRRRAATAFFEPESAQRVVVGAERPYFGLRRDGSNFRGLLVAERFLAAEGTMSAITAREYLSEVEVLLRHLRRPFEIVP